MKLKAGQPAREAFKFEHGHVWIDRNDLRYPLMSVSREEMSEMLTLWWSQSDRAVYGFRRRPVFGMPLSIASFGGFCWFYPVPDVEYEVACA